MLEYAVGLSVLVTGVEDVDGETRVYVGHRSNWRYFVALGPDIENIRRQWTNTSQHLVIRKDELPPLIQGVRPSDSGKEGK